MSFSNLDDRTPVADLFAIADTVGNTKRIVCYDSNTLNTPYKSELTLGINTGTAIISMYNDGNYGMILCMPNGGFKNSLFICMKNDGVWGDWESLAKRSEISRIKIFTHPNQFPHTSPVTDLKSLFKTMPDYSILYTSDTAADLGAISLSDVNGKIPPAGMVEIIKLSEYRNAIRVSRCTNTYTSKNYLCITRYIRSTDSIAPWDIIETVPLT